MNGSLNAPVERFVRTLEPLLREVNERAGAAVDPTRLRRDVEVEASSLVAAFLDADGRQADDELWAYIVAFGPRFRTDLARATPGDVRKAGLVIGKVAWLNEPSQLLDVLATADRAGGTGTTRAYYEEAMQLAHIVVALDAYPSMPELDALERFRTMLLGVVEGAARPTSEQPMSAMSATGARAAAVGKVGEPTPSPEPLAPPRPVDEVLAELDDLVGLEPVKEEVKLVTALLRVQKLRADAGLPTPDSSRHLVFTGNPGTGKTTVARLLAEIYRSLGVVERGHLVETDRSALVAGFVGQTAARVVEAFDRADEGLLLIDEAYALARGGAQDFGREAIDTLVKLVEDRRDRVVVIAAGYPEEMHDFIESNPGLRSRFPKTILFPDYSTEELVAILGLLGERHGYTLDAGAIERARAFLDAQDRGKGFGNGRLARNLFETAIGRQAQRLVALETHSVEQLKTIEAEDVPTA